TNAFDVVFAGIQGSATLFTADATFSLQPGETLFVTSQQERGWKNTTGQPCSILVIKHLQNAS
ncbi:MAG: hypothetical protein R6U64_07920, partial [Bacteroidales bacterium]